MSYIQAVIGLHTTSGGLDSGISYTTNGGNSWTTYGSIQTGTGVSGYTINVATNGNLYICAGGLTGGLLYAYGDTSLPSTWQKTTVPLTVSNYGYTTVGYANDLWVCGVNRNPLGGCPMCWSDNGITWTAGTWNAGSTSFNAPTGIAYAGNVWLVGENGAGIVRSVDGKNWTYSTISGSGIQSIASTPTGNIICLAANKMYYSTDYGITWNAGTVGGSSYFWYTGGRSVTYANGQFVACGQCNDDSPRYIYTSTNGSDWTRRTSFNVNCMGVSYFNNKYYITDGDTHYLFSSSNLDAPQSSWTSIILNSAYTPRVMTVVNKTIPGQPTITYATSSDSVLCSVYSAIGGTSHSSYTYSLNNAAPITVAPTNTLYIGGLMPATTYSFNLYATNTYGNSKPYTGSFTTPAINANVPDAPTVYYTSTANSMNVSFSAPAYTGGSAITSYTYAFNNGSATTVVSPTTISFTGLTFENTYPFALYATNSYGNSTISYNQFRVVICFLEGTQILRANKITGEPEYAAIETLRPGDKIKTYAAGFVPIHTIGYSDFDNPPAKNIDTPNRIYRLPRSKCSELFADLYITGNHCILRNHLSDEIKQHVMGFMGDIYLTEGKYRLPAYLDKRAKPWEKSGTCRIWHFALDHHDITQNYGVYANGMLVESTSIRFMREKLERGAYHQVI